MRGLRLSRAIVTAVAWPGRSGCNRTSRPSRDLSPNTPASGDAGAGRLAHDRLCRPGDFPVPAPAPATVDAYRPSWPRSRPRRGAHRRPARAIDYWSGGGVLRWNEILRELVARYNLPPRAARTAPTRARTPRTRSRTRVSRSPTRPTPRARYSYVSVAQYEALKVAWFYKYQYNRPSPSKSDSGVQALMPDRPARLSVRGRGALRRVRGAAQAALPARPWRRSRAAAEQREAALLSGRPRPATSRRVSPWARRSRPCSRARGTDGCRTAGGSPGGHAGPLRHRAPGRGPVAQHGDAARAAACSRFGQVRPG
jgi:hypothetical protein